jgi:methyl-accepting chemotaxis protein
MAKRAKSPMADLRASMRRMQADGEEMVGRIRRDAQALLRTGRAEIVRDVRGLSQRADKTLRAFESRVLHQLHAATTDQVKRLERRLAKLEQGLAAVERRLGAASKTAA